MAAVSIANVPANAEVIVGVDTHKHTRTWPGQRMDSVVTSVSSRSQPTPAATPNFWHGPKGCP